MLDNRGDWNAADVAGSTRLSLEDRLFGLLASAVRSAIEMARMVSFRVDLYRSRQDLRDLSDEHLRDVGITRREAEAEASRPFFPE